MKAINIILGAVMVIAGIVCIANPLVSIFTIGNFLGALLLVGGVSMVVNGSVGEKSVGSIVLGILAGIGGITILCSSLGAVAAVDILAMIFAAATLIGGITQIVLAIGSRQFVQSWWVTLIVGILNVIVAMMILTNPLTGILVVEIIFAIEIITTGITLIAAGFAF